MNNHDRTPQISSECVDVVMKELPDLFCRLGFAGDAEFVYGVTYFSVQEEQRRGATAAEIRAQRSQILRRIDATNRPPHDSEAFASFFARSRRRRARRPRAVLVALSRRTPDLSHRFWGTGGAGFAALTIMGRFLVSDRRSIRPGSCDNSPGPA